MNPEVRGRWLAALRSGDYRQGHGKLRRDHDRSEDDPGTTYCCLGVLCEVAVEAGVARRVTSTEGVTAYVAVNDGFDRSDNFLPLAVGHWAGLDTPNPVTGRYSLADWNDERHASFARIADLIEEHL